MFIAAARFSIRKLVVVLRLQSVILPLACALFPVAAFGVVFTCVTCESIRHFSQSCNV
jgi:hypothetical protein